MIYLKLKKNKGRYFTLNKNAPYKTTKQTSRYNNSMIENERFAIN